MTKAVAFDVTFKKASELPRKSEFESALEALRRVHPAVTLSHNARGQSCWHCLSCGKSRRDKEALRRLRCKK